MLKQRKMGSANVFTFPLGATATGPTINGDNAANTVVESWLARATASFVETGFDTLTCNATASFQDNVV